MKNIFLLLLFVIGISVASHSQNSSTLNTERRYISVTGTAEMKVVPDEIYITVTLRERFNGKEKVSLETQEETMKKKLSSAGIDLKNLFLSNANSDYVKIAWKKKDVLNSKSYQLKVSSADETTKAFQVFGDIQVYDANITKVDHSRLNDFKKELRINAIKAAKEKAGYMLNAIGEEAGKALSVEEETNNYTPFTYRGNAYANTLIRSSNDGADEAQDTEIQFEKIKLKSQVTAQFEIK